MPREGQARIRKIAVTAAGQTRRRGIPMPSASLRPQLKVPAAHPARPLSVLTLDTRVPQPSDLSARYAAPQARRRVVRILRWAALSALILVLAYGAWLGSALLHMQSNIYVPLPPTPTAQTAIKGLEGGGPVYAPDDAVQPGVSATPAPTYPLPPGRVNILVLGSDKRPNDPDHFARSDSMLLANVDPESKTVRIMSIPRDLV